MTILKNKDYAALTDATLAGLAGRGDERAFEEITIRYIKLIYTISSKYMTDGYETRDFVQEGLLAFLIACKTFDESVGTSFKNFAVRCAKNRFGDILKKAGSKTAVPKSKLVSMETLTEDELPAQSVEDYVLEREYLKTMLNHIFSTLTDEERTVFRMYTQGFSYMEIAEATGNTVKGVDNILQKIKRKLRKSFQG